MMIALLAGKPVVHRVLLLLLLLGAACLPAFATVAGPAAAGQDSRGRQFIAHRGVHLRSTIAGENSLEAIDHARRAGFATIETDVRLTLDGQLVVMHDETLNRTCLRRDGSAIAEPVAVASLTLAELKAGYVLKADAPERRTTIPALREYLVACRQAGLLPFIEPKLYDETGRHYQDIMRVADDVLGRPNYIITSNNKANRVIRDLGIRDVRVMGILYQTTFEEIAGLGNVIMAISTSRFSSEEFARHAARAIAAGLPIESHADDYGRFAVIDAHPVDYVSTDMLAPDLKPGARRLAQRRQWSDFRFAGQVEDERLSLQPRGTVRLQRELPRAAFGGIYLEMEIKGDCTVRLATQEFALSNREYQRCRYQLLVYNTAPGLEITATGPCEIRSIAVTLVEF
jgi:glycerophosphoryl diester phosphodiesterase